MDLGWMAMNKDGWMDEMTNINKSYIGLHVSFMLIDF